MWIQYLYIQICLNQHLILINYKQLKYNETLLLLLYPLYPSAAAIPIDHGIKTISKYKYLHRRTRPYAKTTKYCSWQFRCDHSINSQTCLSHAVPKYGGKKDKADSHQMISEQLVQPPTNTNTTSTKTIYSTSLSGNPTTKPVTPF